MHASCTLRTSRAGLVLGRKCPVRGRRLGRNLRGVAKIGLVLGRSCPGSVPGRNSRIGGGGGNRTRVPGTFSPGFYARSRPFDLAGGGKVGAPAGGQPPDISRPARPEAPLVGPACSCRPSGPAGVVHEGRGCGFRQPLPYEDWQLVLSPGVLRGPLAPRRATSDLTILVETCSPPPPSREPLLPEVYYRRREESRAGLVEIPGSPPRTLQKPAQAESDAVLHVAPRRERARLFPVSKHRLSHLRRTSVVPSIP